MRAIQIDLVVQVILVVLQINLIRMKNIKKEKKFNKKLINIIKNRIPQFLQIRKPPLLLKKKQKRF